MTNKTGGRPDHRGCLNEPSSSSAAATIRSYYPAMFRAERNIADYILAQPEAVMHMTVSKLARAVDAAPSSVVRFCQKLGFSGFTRLKIDLASHLAPSGNPIFEDITREDDAGAVAAKVFAASRRALDETLQMLDREAFGRAAERMLKAGAIWFYGVGTSATLATDASYRFMRIGLPAYAAVDPHIMRLSAGLLGSGDLAVGISYTGRTIDTVRALTIARESGATTLCITSHLGSPIIRVSDLVLAASTSETKVMREATYSRIAHIAILDSLYVCAALGRHDTTVRQLGKITEHLEETRY